VKAAPVADPTLSRRTLLLLLAAFALAWFCNLGYRHLATSDEGRYAEIPREMLATGDWLTPRLNGLKYFEKPPLQYWATAAAFSAFGATEWTARLWTGLTGFLGVLLVFFAGQRLFGPPVGLYAAAVTASAAMYVTMGHMLTLDMGLAFFASAAVLATALAQRDQADETERRRWMLLAWAAAALAVLSKGPIGIVLPAGAVAVYVLVERDWRILARLHVASGALLFAAICVPWFVAVSAVNPEFLRFFFVHEHFERFLTQEHGRYQPTWYFIPVVLLGVLPWVLGLFPALWHAWKRSSGMVFQPRRLLLVWCALVFVFFSASGSKLPSYVLPIFPALALLIGNTLASSGRRFALAQAAIAGLLAIALAAAASQATRYAAANLPAELLAGYVPWLLAAAAALLAAAGVSAWLALRGRLEAATLALAFGSLVSVQTATSGHEALSPAYSAYHVAQQIRDQLKPDVPFYMVDTFDHSLLFYLRRTATMVGVKNELEQPITWEPGRFLPDTIAFARAWQADPEAYAMFNVKDLPGFLDAHPVPMQVVARDVRRVIVKKP
jgi:4-amino-4-deoxy-L-arabinose transferase-like glycosyltransferase